MRSIRRVLVGLLFTFIGGAAEPALAASCFCRATLMEHRTTTQVGYVAMTNVTFLATRTLVIPGWDKNQTIDAARSAAEQTGSCWYECRKAFGVYGNVSAEAAELKADLLDDARSSGMPKNWCGGWLSARLDYRAGTNMYRTATGELIGLASRSCAKIKCSCPLPGSSFDTKNCYAGTPPAGTTPFVYEGKLYYTPAKPGTCSLPGSALAGTNCWLGKAPAGSMAFVYENGLYYTPSNCNQCPVPGSQLQNGACFVATAPAGSQAIAYNGDLYYTPNLCPMPGSSFDTKNCFVGQPPDGTSGFVYNGSLYYTAVCVEIQ